MAPKPIEPAASGYKLSLSGLCQTSGRKRDLQLNCDKKESQTLRSSLTDRVRRIEKFGECTPMVKSIKRRKKTRPGTITQQAKLSKPVRDWTSLKVTFLLRKSDKIPIDLSTLSKGRRASIRQESSSMPAKERICDGPAVFSGAIGMRIRTHI